MQRHTWHLVVWSVATLVALAAVPRVSAQTGTIRCESLATSREQCAIEAGARVELAKHLSETPCVQNANWGVGQGFVWVSRGCRADFKVTALAAYPSGEGNARANPIQLRACRSEADRRLSGYSFDQIGAELYSRERSVAWVRWLAGTTEGMCIVGTNGRVLQFTTALADGGGNGLPGTTRLTCESRGTDRQECRIPEGARIRLVRQLSQNACRLNDTYGRGAGYLWVAEGCRGEFEVRQVEGVSVPGGTPVVRVTCESTGAARRECPIPAGSTARLVGRTSSQPCELNRTYGVSAQYVWVAGGCHGVFEVTSGGAVSAPVDSSGLPASPGLADRVTCESKGVERTDCPIRSGGQVALVRQLSTAACIQNSTWGTSYGVLWVTRGCRGEFEVR